MNDLKIDFSTHRKFCPLNIQTEIVDSSVSYGHQEAIQGEALHVVGLVIPLLHDTGHAARNCLLRKRHHVRSWLCSQTRRTAPGLSLLSESELKRF